MAWTLLYHDAQMTDPDISKDSVVGVWQNEAGRQVRVPHNYKAEDVEREYPSETLTDLQKQLNDLQAKIDALK